MNGKEIVKTLQKLGWKIIRKRGSHFLMTNGQRKTTVPVHGKTDLKIGTLKSIEKQTGVKLR
jgi:predicted RNA binding protein YcfA (HicA-like mRNA interferase family)